MPLGISVVGALCAALLGFGCFKAVRLVSQIKAYKEGTKAVNVTLPADFLALQGGLLGGGAAIGRPLTFFRINDEVMGGKSTSSLAVSGRTLEFSGEINTNGAPLEFACPLGPCDMSRACLSRVRERRPAPRRNRRRLLLVPHARRRCSARAAGSHERSARRRDGRRPAAQADAAHRGLVGNVRAHVGGRLHTGQTHYTSAAARELRAEHTRPRAQGDSVNLNPSPEP